MRDLYKVYGSQEERQLREINHNTRKNNEIRRQKNKDDSLKGASLSRGTKRPRKPASLFPIKDFVYKGGKGINSIEYTEEVLKKEVFPYCYAIRDANLGSVVFLV